MNIIENLISFPLDFERSGLSWHDLLKPDLIEYLNVDRQLLEESLLENENLADKWIEFSENKRSSEGAYISQIAEKEFEVGFFSGMSKIDAIICDNKSAAVCDYIFRELNHFQKISS